MATRLVRRLDPMRSKSRGAISLSNCGHACGGGSRVRSDDDDEDFQRYENEVAGETADDDDDDTDSSLGYNNGNKGNGYK
jgi:hypothetical protein